MGRGYTPEEPVHTEENYLAKGTDALQTLHAKGSHFILDLEIYILTYTLFEYKFDVTDPCTSSSTASVHMNI